MFSSARRGQVEPLPALLAVAAFAIALSLYGTTLESIPIGPEPAVPDATVTKTMDILTEGTVVQPDRLPSLAGQIPAGTMVVVRADGQTWRYGEEQTPGDGPSTVRRVLVQRPDGVVSGIVRVSV